MAKKKFYITTAIDYVNAKPHCGHAFEKTLADAILDRLVHNAHRLELNGESLRKDIRELDEKINERVEAIVRQASDTKEGMVL